MTIDKHPSLHDRHRGLSFTKRSPLSTRLSSLSGLRDHTFTRAMSLPRASYDSSSYSYEERRSTKPSFSPSYSNGTSSLKRESGNFPSYTYSTSSLKRDSGDSRSHAFSTSSLKRHSGDSRSHGFSTSSLRRDSGDFLTSFREEPINLGSSPYSTLGASSEITPTYGTVYRQGASLGAHIDLPRSDELTFYRGDGYSDGKPLISSPSSSFSPSSARTASIFDSMHSPTNGVHSVPKNRFHREDHMRSDYYRRSTTKTNKSLSPFSPTSASTPAIKASDRRDSGADPKFRVKSSKDKPGLESDSLSSLGYVRLQQQRDASGNPLSHGPSSSKSANGNPLSHGPSSPRSADISSLRDEETLTTSLASLRPEESTALTTVHAPPPYPMDAVNATSFYPGDVDYVHTYNKYNEMRHVSFIDYEVKPFNRIDTVTPPSANSSSPNVPL